MYHLLIHNELGIQGGVLNRKGWIYVREQGDVRNNLIREMHKGKKINLKAPLLLLLVNGRNPSQQGKRCFLKCH
jgi:hypothetical protein